MNIVVTGSLGNIGKPLTEELISQGHQVTVISHSKERKGDIEALGAQAAIGSLTDAGFLSKAFEGADAVFAMVPPYFAADVREYSSAIGNNYATAIRNAGVKRVVQLSSWGAHLSEGTGMILGAHDVERILQSLPAAVSLTHVRPGSFYTNLYSFTDMIKGTGMIMNNYGGDDRIAWVHPRDIAAVVAEELNKQTGADSVRYVASDERTASETAAILGAAIGMPGLQWVTLSDEQAQQGMEQAGMPTAVAALLVELGASIHSGRLGEDYEKHKPEMRNVKVADFAQDFAAFFK